MLVRMRVWLVALMTPVSICPVGGQDMHHRRRLDPFVERQQDEALLERFLALHVDTAREPEATRAAVERWLSAARIPFSWNEAALEESGIELSAPVTGVLVKVPLETAFELILEPLGVRWVVEDQQIKFTAEDGSEHQYSKIYPLREPEGKKFVLSEVFGPWSQEHAQVVLGTDLYAANFAPFRGREVERPRFENSPSSKIEYQTLELEPSSVSRSWDEDLPWLLQCLTSGPWADSEGAGGSMSLHGPYLHVRQTLRGHLEIRSLLDQFRAQAWKDAKPEGVRLRPGADLQLGAREEQDQEEAWRRALLQPMDFDVSDQPWIKMLREFGQQRGLSCWIDETAMQDEGIDPQVALQRKVTLQLRQQPLQSALSPLLDELELNWILEDGVLKITTAGMGCEWQETRIYDVTGIELIHRPRE
ncbi:MAG: STN domain-containing protein, partial [Planctomycetaceae bacterium]|nr:STN domain-containing protein [Planctomycetaceae bacterium]